MYDFASSKNKSFRYSYKSRMPVFYRYTGFVFENVCVFSGEKFFFHEKGCIFVSEDEDFTKLEFFFR